MSSDFLMTFYVLIISMYYILVNLIGVTINLYGQRFALVRDYRLEPTVSVVMSAFNEGQAVYNTIKSMRLSDYPVEKLEILAFDDCSKDDTFRWMQQAASDFPNVIAIQSKQNQGKAHNVLDAFAISKGEIIVSVDSDCVFEPNAIRELVVCFSEKKLAAVGGRVGISNANVNWLTRFQTIAYALSFLIIKSPENICRKIQCLSGPLVAIRRECFEEIKHDIKHRHFLGIRITNGEDRALTQMLLLRGYDTYLNNHAKCYTTAPETLSQYAKQQLRWRRSAVGQYFQLCLFLHQMIRCNGFMSSIFSLLPVFVLLIWNVMVITAWLAGTMLSMLMAIVIVHFMMGPCIAIAFYVYAHYLSNHADLRPISLFDLIYCRLAASFWYPLSTVIVTLFALFTLDDGGWVTRENSASSPH